MMAATARTLACVALLCGAIGVRGVGTREGHAGGSLEASADPTVGEKSDLVRVGSCFYVVTEGDSIESIAGYFGTPVPLLESYNNWVGFMTRFQVGMKLHIPAVARGRQARCLDSGHASKLVEHVEEPARRAEATHMKAIGEELAEAQRVRAELERALHQHRLESRAATGRRCEECDKRLDAEAAARKAAEERVRRREEGDRLEEQAEREFKDVSSRRFEEEEGLPPCRYTTRPGDTYGSVSAQFGIVPRLLRIANGLEREASNWADELGAYTRLNVPAPRSSSRGFCDLTVRVCPYVVRRGDSLGHVADKFGASRVHMALVNKLPSSRFTYYPKLGARLLVPNPSVEGAQFCAEASFDKEVPALDVPAERVPSKEGVVVSNDERAGAAAEASAHAQAHASALEEHTSGLMRRAEELRQRRVKLEAEAEATKVAAQEARGRMKQAAGNALAEEHAALALRKAEEAHRAALAKLEPVNKELEEVTRETREATLKWQSVSAEAAAKDHHAAAAAAVVAQEEMQNEQEPAALGHGDIDYAQAERDESDMEKARELLASEGQAMRFRETRVASSDPELPQSKDEAVHGSDGDPQTQEAPVVAGGAPGDGPEGAYSPSPSDAASAQRQLARAQELKEQAAQEAVLDAIEDEDEADDVGTQALRSLMEPLHTGATGAAETGEEEQQQQEGAAKGEVSEDELLSRDLESLLPEPQPELEPTREPEPEPEMPEPEATGSTGATGTVSAAGVARSEPEVEREVAVEAEQREEAVQVVKEEKKKGVKDRSDLERALANLAHLARQSTWELDQLREAHARAVAARDASEARVRELEERIARHRERAEGAEEDVEGLEHELWAERRRSARMHGRVLALQQHLEAEQRRRYKAAQHTDELEREVVQLKRRLGVVAEEAERSERRARETEVDKRREAEDREEARQLALRQQAAARKVAAGRAKTGSTVEDACVRAATTEAEMHELELQVRVTNDTIHRRRARLEELQSEIERRDEAIEMSEDALRTDVRAIKHEVAVREAQATEFASMYKEHAVAQDTVRKLRGQLMSTTAGMTNGHYDLLGSTDAAIMREARRKQKEADAVRAVADAVRAGKLPAHWMDENGRIKPSVLEQVHKLAGKPPAYVDGRLVVGYSADGKPITEDESYLLDQQDPLRQLVQTVEKVKVEHMEAEKAEVAEGKAASPSVPAAAPSDDHRGPPIIIGFKEGHGLLYNTDKQEMARASLAAHQLHSLASSSAAAVAVVQPTLLLQQAESWSRVHAAVDALERAVMPAAALLEVGAEAAAQKRVGKSSSAQDALEPRSTLVRDLREMLESLRGAMADSLNPLKDAEEDRHEFFRKLHDEIEPKVHELQAQRDRLRRERNRLQAQRATLQDDLQHAVVVFEDAARRHGDVKHRFFAALEKCHDSMHSLRPLREPSIA